MDSIKNRSESKIGPKPPLPPPSSSSSSSIDSNRKFSTNQLSKNFIFMTFVKNGNSTRNKNDLISDGNRRDENVSFDNERDSRTSSINNIENRSIRKKPNTNSLTNNNNLDDDNCGENLKQSIDKNREKSISKLKQNQTEMIGRDNLKNFTPKQSRQQSKIHPNNNSNGTVLVNNKLKNMIGIVQGDVPKSSSSSISSSSSPTNRKTCLVTTV